MKPIEKYQYTPSEKECTQSNEPILAGSQYLSNRGQRLRIRTHVDPVCLEGSTLFQRTMHRPKVVPSRHTESVVRFNRQHLLRRCNRLLGYCLPGNMTI